MGLMLELVYARQKPTIWKQIKSHFIFGEMEEEKTYFHCVPKCVVRLKGIGIEDVEPEEENVDRKETEGKQDGKRLEKQNDYYSRRCLLICSIYYQNCFGQFSSIRILAWLITDSLQKKISFQFNLSS